MRPKKKVLLYCYSEAILSVTKFMLETRLYAVYAVESLAVGAELIESKRTEFFDAAVIIRSELHDYAADMIDVSNKFNIPTMLVDRLQNVPINVVANAVLYPPANMPANIVETLKILCARKRGPKPVRAEVQQAVSA